MKSFHAGDYVSQGWYNSYSPNPINRNWVMTMCLIKLFAFRVRGGETKPPQVLRLVEVI